MNQAERYEKAGGNIRRKHRVLEGSWKSTYFSAEVPDFAPLEISGVPDYHLLKISSKLIQVEAFHLGESNKALFIKH